MIGLARKARRSGLGLVAGLALVVGACAPRPGPAPVPPAPPAAGPVKAQTPRAEPHHRIAILAPLSGANAAVGTSLSNAAMLALSDTGAGNLRVTSYDTAALGAAGAAQRALDEGAQLILGPLLSADVGPARALAAQRGVTMLSFSNDAAMAGGNVYVLGFQPAQSVARVVDYTRSRGVTRFAGLIPAGIYGERAAVAFTQAVDSGGGRVVAIANYSRDARALAVAARKVTDYDARLRKAGAVARRPDGTIAPLSTTLGPVPFQALLVADSGAIAGRFAPLLDRFGAPAGSYLMLGTELWNTETGLAAVAALKGAVFASVPDRRFEAMAARYRARFGTAPSRLASLSYDAMLLATSAAHGQGWAAGEPFPAAMLADRKGFAGIDGIFRFSANVAERGLEVQQVGAGGFVVVDPAPAAFR